MRRGSTTVAHALGKLPSRFDCGLDERRKNDTYCYARAGLVHEAGPYLTPAAIGLFALPIIRMPVVMIVAMIIRPSIVRPVIMVVIWVPIMASIPITTTVPIMPSIIMDLFDGGSGGWGRQGRHSGCSGRK